MTISAFGRGSASSISRFPALITSTSMLGGIRGSVWPRPWRRLRSRRRIRSSSAPVSSMGLLNEAVGRHEAQDSVMHNCPNFQACLCGELGSRSRALTVRENGWLAYMARAALPFRLSRARRARLTRDRIRMTKPKATITERSSAKLSTSSEKMNRLMILRPIC
jgi:hypothetical protein